MDALTGYGATSSSSGPGSAYTRSQPPMLQSRKEVMIGSPRFQHGSLIRVKNKTTDDTWFLRFYEDVQGQRVYRKQKIGSVRQYPRRSDADKAVLALRAKINVSSGVRAPETVGDLLTHYTQYELGEEGGKRSSTREVYAGYIKVHVEPNWSAHRLDQVKTIDVERWLRSLKLAPASKCKIKNIMSAVFSHAKRHGMVPTNPIQGVRCSSKRLREPDVLSPEEFRALIDELPHRERVMILLAGTTGLRRSELIALKWEDVNFQSLEISVTKSCVRGLLEDQTKTVGSSKPVPIHVLVVDALKMWHQASPYNTPGDFLFPSLKMNGSIPVWPDMVLQDIIRPAVDRAGIVGKIVGWHTLRHSLATNLRSLGIDVKVAQELLRHASCRTTLDIYSQAVSAQKREASGRVVDLLWDVERRSAPLSTLE
jgi:integrase